MQENNQKIVTHLDDLFRESRNTLFIHHLHKGLNIQDIIDSQSRPNQTRNKNKIMCNEARLILHDGTEISIAGGGILGSDEDFAEMVRQNPDAEFLCQHADCGAEKVAFKKAQEAGTVPEGITTAREFGEAWARKKCKEHNLKYLFIDVDQFNDHYHHESGIVLDLTGTFHPSFVDGMPNVFPSDSGASHSKEYVKAELNILTGISLSDHAFGKRLTTDDPYIILVCAKDEDQKMEWIEVAKVAIEEYGDRVQVMGFISPYLRVAA